MNSLPLSLVAALRSGQRRARGGQDVDHLARLLLGIQERVIAQRGDVVAGVVRRHDDVALRGEHGRDEHALGVVVLVMSAMFKALSVLVPCAYSTMGRGPLQAGAAARGHHQRAGGLGGLTGAAQGPELDVVEIHAAQSRGFSRPARHGSG
jgi:hypothetical protein